MVINRLAARGEGGEQELLPPPSPLKFKNNDMVILG
jgi:hypothetical protein